MRHGTATFITRIRADKLAALEALLDEAAGESTALFTGVPGLHFARWAIIDLSTPEPRDGPRDLRLVFGTDATFPDTEAAPEALDARLVHGLVSRLARLRALGARAAALFDGIQGACHGYPAPGLEAPAAVETWLLQHRVEAITRHVDFAYRFESPEELRDSVDVLRAVDRHLDARAPQLARSPWRGRRRELADLHAELRDHAASVSSTLFEPGWRRRLAAARASAAASTWAYAFYRLCWSLPAVLYLQWRLRRERASRPPGPVPRVSAVAAPWSDAMVQQPMVHVVRISGGPLGLKLAKVALRSVDLRLRRYVVGLNHIQTIHCARWVLHSDGDGAGPHHLIFFSNYDDSWEAYIDAFIDHADVRGFLELIWSQSEGFPARTAGDFVESFKAWLRAHEVPTRVWYSAALDGGPRQRHSVLLLHNALRLRELLTRERIDRPLGDWSARRAFAAFLSRGACSPGRALLRPLALARHSLSALSSAWSNSHGLTRPEPFPPAPPAQPAAP